MNIKKLVTENLYRKQSERRNVTELAAVITNHVKSGLARRRGNMAALQAQIHAEIAPLLTKAQNSEWGAVWLKA